MRRKRKKGKKGPRAKKRARKRTKAVKVKRIRARKTRRKKAVKKRKAVGKRKVSKRRTAKKPVAKKTRTKRAMKRRKARASKKFIRKHTGNPAHKPIYALNTDFEFFYELRDLISKSSPAEKDKMVDRLNKIGRIKLAIISGIFINKENLDPLITDLLVVGDDIDRRKLRAFLKATEAEVGKEIRFTVMDKDEFQYRMAMFDRFIRVLLEAPHEKLINRLGI